ncbi:DUF2971 domain-containing protein [Methylopila sp. M107]|uniref:DUF2971 domain-containing protein n=1 Tax=Methylopila sp. M107 TaxID=1101190 RepID=UPI0009DB810A|nr:DUF2971 domain-containing protein [Methylopila sp. M107]
MADVAEDIVDELVAHLKEPPAAPPLLYKYLSPERIDVLQNANIRYTQLYGTNDVFEIRRTFETMYGQKMKKAVRATTASINIEEEMVKAIAEAQNMSLRNARRWLKQNRNDPRIRSVEENAPTLMANFLDNFLPKTFGNQDFIMHILNNFAKKTAALSVSEQPHSPSMWAHYAANWTGYVISFDTADGSLTPSPENGSRFFPISYRNDMINEFFDDPIGALFSKQTDWANEREWRKIIRREQADRIIATQPDDVLLNKFDRSAVERVIVGHRADPDFVDALRAELQAYPKARLYRTQISQADGTVSEIAI